MSRLLMIVVSIQFLISRIPINVVSIVSEILTLAKSFYRLYTKARFVLSWWINIEVIQMAYQRQAIP